MARYIADFQTGKPDDMIRFITEDFFQKEGFTLVNFKGEAVWKKGSGLMTAPQFVKLSSVNGTVHLEAWLKNAILPGVYVGELGLNGAYGWAIKKVLKDRVNTLTSLLLQGAPEAVPAAVPAAAAAQAIPVQNTVPAAAPSAELPANGLPVVPAAPGAGQVSPYPAQVPAVPVAVHDPRGKATASLVLGLVSIIGCFWPFPAIVTSIIGIITGVTGRKSTARGMATVGMILSIVFLIVSVVDLIFYYLVTFSQINALLR